MKKYFIIIIILVIILVIIPNNSSNDEVRGVFISYIEISKYLKDQDEYTSKKRIDEMISNIESLKLNTIILQVRPSMDAMYYSKIFPLSTYLTSTNMYPYDVLEYFIKKSHSKRIKVIAWINPYRISTVGTRNDILKTSPIYDLRNSDLVYEKNGLYLNPSKRKTNSLIEEGVKEVLSYNVDGILFDDYFYPSDDIDINDYNNYIKNNNYISMKDYHLMIVNEMLYRVHEICKKKKVAFGISPDGNIENNYEMHYADVLAWLQSNKYIDFIMPQLYYGINNSNKPFYKTAEEWNNYIKTDIPLYIALAAYKSNTIDIYAKDGEKEWLDYHDILKREIMFSRELSKYKGFTLYRFDNVFTDEHSKEEIKNIELLLNE